MCEQTLRFKAAVGHQAMHAYDSFAQHEPVHFAALLPLIRAEQRRGMFGNHYQVAAIYASEIVTGRCGYLEDVHQGLLDAPALASRLAGARRIPLTDSSRVTFSPGNRRTLRARFQLSGSGRATFWVPNHDVEHLLSFLKSQLGERLNVRKRTPYNSFGLQFLCLILLAMTVFTIRFVANSLLIAIILGCLTSILSGAVIYSHLTAPPPWQPARGRTKTAKDLSGRQPFRWPVIGMTLKVACGGFLILSSLAWAVLGNVMIVFWPMMAISALGLYCGQALSQRKPEYVRAGDSRPPILYLRSFLDDRRQTLVANTRWAAAAGVLPPSMLPMPWNYVLRFSPIRVLRVLLNRSVDTAEEQLGLFMRRLGPFVAIGQPGERFAAPGAARMYVTNDEWKGVVDSFLIESQYIVLQPARTEGIWWEVERALQNAPLRKVLFCLVNFHLRQNDYEAFHLRIKPLLNDPVPIGGGLTTTPAFLYFDAQGMPRLVSTSYSSPFLWPWFLNAVDLKSTLKPFLAPAPLDSSGIGMRRPRGMSGISHFLANCAYIAVIIGLPSLVSIALWFPEVLAERQARKQEAGIGVNGRQPSDVAVPASPLDKLSLEAEKLFAAKDFEGLDRVTAQMVALAPDNSNAHIQRGIYFQQIKNFPEALKEFTQAVKLSPQDSGAWNVLGLTQFELGKVASAEASFSKSIKLRPDQPNFYLNRGEVRLDQKNYAAAAADFAKAVKLGGPLQALAAIKCGVALQRSGKIVESLPYFNSAVQLEQANVDYQLLRALAFQELGNRQFKDGNAAEFALSGFESALKLNPASGPGHKGRALSLQMLNRHAEALVEFDRLLVDEPRNDFLLRQRGMSHLQCGHYNAAHADFQKSAEINPTDLTAPEMMIRIYVAQGKLDEALALCEVQLKVTNDKLGVLSRKATLLVLTSRNDEADSVLEDLVPRLIKQTDPNRLTLGMMLMMQSDRQPALMKRAMVRANQLAWWHTDVPMLKLLPVALHIRLNDDGAAAKALRAVDRKKLNSTPMAVAFHQLCEAILDSHKSQEQRLDHPLAEPISWFEQNCSVKFEEGQPETLSGDWTARSLLGRFYRDRLPSRQ